MTQNSKLKLKELISVAFQLRMLKVLKLKQIPRSSSPRTCGFKPPTDMFPTAERPRQQDAAEIDDKAKARKGKGTWSNPSQ